MAIGVRPKGCGEKHKNMAEFGGKALSEGAVFLFLPSEFTD
jgi:hypothetical protein